MGKKIFVSYKYSDDKVLSLPNVFGKTTARNYVDKIDEILESDDHIFKGEDDGQSLATLSDASIATKLGDKIFDSSITIVLISKGMKNVFLAERDQWMPWEISYSLSEQSRENKSSKTNAVLAVVLPDENGSYQYYIEENICNKCNCRILKTDFLFNILSKNMFNIKQPQFIDCANHTPQTIYSGYSSYIYSVKWDLFLEDYSYYLGLACNIKQNIQAYTIVKRLG